MKQLLLAVPLVLAASAGAAQVVQFRSGEHEDFTRLVATLPTEDTNWTISGDGKFYTIKIDGDDLRLKTNTIFDRIPRTRLANFVANDARGEIELELACDCRIVSIPYNDRYVIFDIRAGLSPQPDNLPQVPLSFGVAVKQETPKREFRFTSLEAAKPAPVVLEEKLEVKKLDVPYSDLLAFETFVKRNAQVETLRRDLVAQVDRATDQKLLDPKQMLPQVESYPTPDPVEMASAESTAIVKDDHVPHRATKGQVGKDHNIVAYNVIDEVGRDIAALLSGQVGRGTCLPDTAVDISSWSGNRTFVEELAKLRQQLVGEFDRTNDEALLKLARLYVHYTFGAEALQVLQLLPESNENLILRDMAHIVDGDVPLETENSFEFQAHCSGHATLWAALSGQPLVGESAIKGALDALHTMPRHLREHLGPKLSNRFVEQGETEAATLVLNAIERANPVQDANFSYAQATLDAELGNTEAAEDTYSEIASQNTDLATVAVVKLIDSHVDKAVAPAPETISLVGALAVEHKSGAMGPELRRAHALARMLEQEFVAAFGIIDDIETRDGGPAASKVRSQIVNAMIEHADDYDIIAWTLQQKLAEPGRLSAGTALSLAQKTFELGFVGETKRLLQAAQTMTPSNEKRLLKARVALADNLPKRAEAELLGIMSPEADQLRARARAMAGDHAGAAQLLADLGERSKAEAEAWLDGDLVSLAVSETEIYRKTSTLLTPEDVEVVESADAAETPPSSTQGVLARNRALLEGSAESRSVLGELLDWHQLSEPAS